MFGVVPLFMSYVGFSGEQYREINFLYFPNLLFGFGVFMRISILRVIAIGYLCIVLMVILILPYGGAMEFRVDMAVTARGLLAPALGTIFLLWFLRRVSVIVEFKK